MNKIVRFMNKKLVIGGLLSGFAAVRNFALPKREIDIRPNKWEKYMGEQRQNLVFCDYYSYWADPHELNSPPCYQVWNFSIHPVVFKKN